jgi:hypothetical protein
MSNPVHRIAGNDGINGRVRKRDGLRAARQGTNGRQRAAQLGPHGRIGLDSDDLGSQFDQRGGQLAGSGAEVEHAQSRCGLERQFSAALA